MIIHFYYYEYNDNTLWYITIAIIPVKKNIIKHLSWLELFCISNNDGLYDIKNKNPKIKIKEEIVKTDSLVPNIFFVYINRLSFFNK